MTPFFAIELIEGIVEAPLDQVLEAWQYLLATGIVWQLQGAYGRKALDLIEQGLIINNTTHN